MKRTRKSAKVSRKIAKETRNDTKGRERKLNAQLVRRMMRGYRWMNKFTAQEERAWAARMTPREARRLFLELDTLWEQSNARAGGNWQAVERLRIKEKIETQRRFVLLARRIKQI